MAAIDVTLSSFELDRFAEILRDRQIGPSSYTVVCRRFTPTHGPTTEAVQIEGATFGRDGGSTWLDDFQRDVAARHLQLVRHWANSPRSAPRQSDLA